MKLLHETERHYPPHLREMFKDNLPIFLTRCLPKKYQTDYVILAQIKQKKKSFFPFLLLVCHRSFEYDLRRKLDMDLLLDIEAKKMGRG